MLPPTTTTTRLVSLCIVYGPKPICHNRLKQLCIPIPYLKSLPRCFHPYLVQTSPFRCIFFLLSHNKEKKHAPEPTVFCLLILQQIFRHQTDSFVRLFSLFLFLSPCHSPHNPFHLCKIIINNKRRIENWNFRINWNEFRSKRKKPKKKLLTRGLLSLCTVVC